jgi:hypothetical protein
MRSRFYESNDVQMNRKERQVYSGWTVPFPRCLSVNQTHVVGVCFSTSLQILWSFREVQGPQGNLRIRFRSATLSRIPAVQVPLEWVLTSYHT